MTSPADVRSLEKILRDACTTPGWTAVHAGEALIALGQPRPVAAAFLNWRNSTEPRLRIGVWRVLARSVEPPADRATYVDRIRAVLLDTQAVDRVHALEALAKLNAPPTSPAERTAVAAMTEDPAAAPFAWWRLVESDDPSAAGALIGCMKSPDVVCRSRAANALAHLPQVDAAAALRSALAAEPVGSAAHPWLAAGVGGDVARVELGDRSPANRYAATLYFANHGTPSDVTRLEPLVNDKDIDVRVGCAFALLAIAQRAAPDIQPNPPAAIAAQSPRTP